MCCLDLLNRCYGQFEEYSRCSAACVVGCDNLNFPLSCPTCSAGCVCKSGYVREVSTNRYSRCIQRSQCLPTSSYLCNDMNSQFFQCKPSCFETCYGTSCNYQSRCEQGCVCKEGYIRQSSDINSPCLLRSQCIITNPNPNPYPNSCTDPNMYFSQCGTACPESCQGQASSCSMPCVQGCFCNSGYVRESSSGNTRCIRREQCPSVQQPYACTDVNEVFSFCGTACQETCQGANSVCSMQCVKGCFCRPGYVRESSAFGARCLLRSVCLSSAGIIGQCTDPNSQYSTCAPACEETCESSSQICGQTCRSGCFCKPGYAKMNNNLGSFCVLKSQCMFYGGLNPAGGYNPFGSVFPSGVLQPQSGGYSQFGGMTSITQTFDSFHALSIVFEVKNLERVRILVWIRCKGFATIFVPQTTIARILRNAVIQSWETNVWFQKSSV